MPNAPDESDPSTYSISQHVVHSVFMSIHSMATRQDVLVCHAVFKQPQMCRCGLRPAGNLRPSKFPSFLGARRTPKNISPKVSRWPEYVARRVASFEGREDFEIGTSENTRPLSLCFLHYNTGTAESPLTFPAACPPRADCVTGPLS
jgi:hypothetical protein